MPDTLIVLIGPTGVGKTELSLSIAEHFRTSIVSADSRQLYADLKIGTAAPTPEQLARVPHYFVGTLQLTDYYSAAQYEADVLAQLEILYHHLSFFAVFIHSFKANYIIQVHNANFKIKTNTSPMQNNYCSQYNSDHPRWNMPPSQMIPSYTPCRHPSTVPP